MPSDFSSVANGRQVQGKSGQGDYFPSYLPARPQALPMAVLPAEASSPLQPERPQWGLGTIPFFSSLDLGVVAASLLANPRELHYPSHTFVYSAFIPFSSIPFVRVTFVSCQDSSSKWYQKQPLKMRFWDWAADTFIKHTCKYQVCVRVLRLGD